ncbi:hypothetical protein [Gemmatimonas sp.]|jgi:hypothetical protein|uniref:hypothetical protein n=1 Tax=Gemmatimonas sp. TaxID=1962908 RepID=UPI0037BFF3B3
MTTTAFGFDPRQRMRDALRTLIREHPVDWHQPTLLVVRNRLLDHAGSDARPYAELLLEAYRRGWHTTLPTTALDQARWNAMMSPFLLQWCAERFLLPEMARWALESWAYALGVIGPSQLTVAPPPEPIATPTPLPRAPTQTRPTPTTAAAAPSPAKSAGPAPLPRSIAPRKTRSTGSGPRSRSVSRASARTTATTPGTTTGKSATATTANRASRSVATSPVVDWVTRAVGGALALIAMSVLVRVALSPRQASLPTPITAPIATASGAPADSEPAQGALAGAPVRGDSGSTVQSPLSAPEGSAGSFAIPVAPSSITPTRGGRLVPSTITGGVPVIATERPGVPSITKSVLPASADSARMMFVQPARRAGGDPRVASRSAGRPMMTFDELRLRSGQVLRGRVDVVQAGSVLFRDQKTGLRYEIRKDDIDEIISEFGVPVRFRAAGTTPPVDGSGAVRSKGVAGRFRLRYEAARAVGSRECVEVWAKAPNAEDIAVVRHRPGDDTLSVAFEGGDVFPSNIDAEGWFASTFRIVPDQARTMTALTTRLNGRFTPTGGLQVTVSIVYFRRMRTGGDVTCNVTVNATGRRE